MSSTESKNVLTSEDDLIKSYVVEASRFILNKGQQIHILAYQLTCCLLLTVRLINSFELIRHWEWCLEDLGAVEVI